MNSETMPSLTALRLWRARIERAKTKRKDWITEARENVDLGSNKPGAWAARTPVAGDRTGKSALVVRNTIGQNARQEVNRMMPKEPKWVVKPIVPFVYEEGPDGASIEQSNTDRAQIVQTCANFLSAACQIPDELERAALDGEYTDVAFIKVGYLGGGDISHTAPLPMDERAEGGQSGDLTAKEKKRAKRPGLAHGSVKPYRPYVVRVPYDRVLVDPDAATEREVNWYAQEIVRPLGPMKKEMVNEVDHAAMEVKRRPKYENLKDIMPNAKPGEIVTGSMGTSNVPRATPDAYAEDFLTFWEIHYRVPEEEPDTTVDGFEYYILSFVDYAEGTAETPPICIRHERYPIDCGAFYLTLYVANIVNDDLLGFVPGIRDSKAPSLLFNTLASGAVNWVTRNKTVRWYNSNAVEADDIAMLADAEAGDFVPLNLKQNVPLEALMGVVPASPLPPDLVQYQQFMLNIANEQTGRSNNQRGDITNAKTAAETNVVAQETSGQVAAKQKRFRKFAAEVMRKSLVIFSHVLPEQGPMKEGRWALPDPENPGKFLQFQKRDLFCHADIELDITSQVLRDDTVVVQQGMQLLDVLSKILAAPPEIFERLVPLLERVIAAMGPDWESKAHEMFKPNEEANSPENEHLMFAAGEYHDPDQNEDIQEHIEKHSAMLKVATREPALAKLFGRVLGKDQQGNTITPLVLLAHHLATTEEIAQKKGMAVKAGVLPRNRGSGPGTGRPNQAAPSAGELQAGAATVGTTTPGVR